MTDAELRAHGTAFGALADFEIEEARGRPEAHPFRLRIDPFVGGQCKALADGSGREAISYGLGPYGYDIRLGSQFRGLLPGAEPIDPFKPEAIWGPQWSCEPGEAVTIPPHGVLLAESVEVVRVPEDVTVLVLCKSTWARCFLNLNTTPLEAGWQGTVTLELANMAPRPLVVYPGHGVGQLQFFRGRPCKVPYNRRPGGGTYQNQKGPTPPKRGRRAA